MNNLTTEQLIVELTERGNTDPKRDEILSELESRLFACISDRASWELELEHTKDYLTSQDIERNLQQIESDELAIRSVLRREQI